MLYFTDIKVFPHLLLDFIRYWQTREGKTRCLWSAVRRRAHWTPQRLSKLPKSIQYIKVRNRSQGFAFLVHCSFHMAPSLGSLFLSDSGHFLPLTTSCIAHSLTEASWNHWGNQALFLSFFPRHNFMPMSHFFLAYSPLINELQICRYPNSGNGDPL